MFLLFNFLIVNSKETKLLSKMFCKDTSIIWIAQIIFYF